jgi:hypothetical protein
MVETMGLQPTTPCVQTWASPIPLDVDARKVQLRGVVVQASDRPGRQWMWERCAITRLFLERNTFTTRRVIEGDGKLKRDEPKPCPCDHEQPVLVIFTGSGHGVDVGQKQLLRLPRGRHRWPPTCIYLRRRDGCMPSCRWLQWECASLRRRCVQRGSAAYWPSGGSLCLCSMLRRNALQLIGRHCLDLLGRLPIFGGLC